MRVNLPATLIPPLIFWACESTTPPVIVPDLGGTQVADAGAKDAEGLPDAIDQADAEGFPDADEQPDADGFPDAEPGDAGNPGCTYPSGAVEPMALNEVLTAYSWPNAINYAGDNFPFSLEQYHCGTDPNVDRSRFEHILFVSIPAW